MRRFAAILVALTLLFPAAALFAAKPLPCCCKTAKSCPLQKARACGGCSMSRAMPLPAQASIPFETRWTIDSPLTIAVPESDRTFPAPPARQAHSRAQAPNVPPPRPS